MKNSDSLLLESIYTNKVYTKHSLRKIVEEFFVESKIEASPKLLDVFTTLFEQATEQQAAAELQGPAAEMIKTIQQQYQLSDEQVKQLIQQLQQAQGDPGKIQKILQTIDPKATQAFQQVQQSQQAPANESLQRIVENAWVQATSTLLAENFAPNDRVWNFLFEDLQSSLHKSSTLLTEGKREVILSKIQALKNDIKDYVSAGGRKGASISAGTTQRIQNALKGLVSIVGGQQTAPTAPTAPASTAPVSTAPAPTAPAPTAPAPTAPASTAPASTAPASTAPASTAPASTAPTQPKQSFFSKAKDWVGKKLSGGWNWIKNNKWKTLGAVGALGALGVIAATGGAAALPMALAKAGSSALMGAKGGAIVGGIKGAVSSTEKGFLNRIKSGAKGALKGAATGAAIAGLGSLAGSAVGGALANGASGITDADIQSDKDLLDANADERHLQQQASEEGNPEIDQTPPSFEDQVNTEFKDQWSKYSKTEFDPNSAADKNALQNILYSVKQQGLDLSQMSTKEKASLFNKAWQVAKGAVGR